MTSRTEVFPYPAAEKKRLHARGFSCERWRRINLANIYHDLCREGSIREERGERRDRAIKVMAGPTHDKYSITVAAARQ